MSLIQKFIVENPYRLIGILSNSKIGEIKRNINKIKAFNKIGKDLKIEFDVEGISFPNFKSGFIPRKAQDSQVSR